MQYATIAGVEKPVSRLVLGTMIVNRGEREKSFALLDAAATQGITALDCAHVYAGGDSERCVGEWMQERGNRERTVIVTKGCHHNADRQRVTPWDIAADLHDSLARLKTPYVDVWLLHRDDTGVPVGPIVETLDGLRRQGKVRAYGGSNWTHTRLAEANAYAAAHGLTPFTASSPNFSLAEQVRDPWGPGCVSIGGPANTTARSWYATAGMPVLAYSSLARGLLSGRLSRTNWDEAAKILDHAAHTAYAHDVNLQRLDRLHELAARRGCTVAQLALAWVLQQPIQVHALVGAASAEEIAACVQALDLRLTPAELAWLDLRAAAAAG
jgi:aryl-alcohol dehydrogenase-like predicted oxidoreductase